MIATDTPAYRTKLIEVGLPLQAINVAANQEKRVRNGHPFNMNLYWARRPLAACRAVIFASVVDDPSTDPDLVAQGPQAVRERRQELHQILAELCPWPNATDEQVLRRARAAMAASLARELSENDESRRHGLDDLIAESADSTSVDEFLSREAPEVYDPFAGGASIPIEAGRLGLRALGGDINPIAVLINRCWIDMVPRQLGRNPINPPDRDRLICSTRHTADGLAADFAYYGEAMIDYARSESPSLYSDIKIDSGISADRPDLAQHLGSELEPIAWLWARTIPSPDPSTKGARIPLMRSFWLCKKTARPAFLEPHITAEGVAFKVRLGNPPKASTVNQGTMTRSGAICPISGAAVPWKRLRELANAGKFGLQLIAVALKAPSRRLYLAAHEVPNPPTASISVDPTLPDIQLHAKPLGIQAQLWGFDTVQKLYLDRQKTALRALCDGAKRAREDAIADGADDGYANCLYTLLVHSVLKTADLANSGCTWEPEAECPRHLFGQQTIPMAWDIAEGNVFGTASGSCNVIVNNSARALRRSFASGLRTIPGAAISQDATTPLPNRRSRIVITDPPYYDNIGYADLSDFFYIWTRAYLAEVHSDTTRTIETPKTREVVACPGRFENDRGAADAHFESLFAESVRAQIKNADSRFPLVFFYAHKQSERGEGDHQTGWSRMLEGLIGQGLMITATWPFASENHTRLRAMSSNALASSIVICCRPRPDSSRSTTRAEFVRELRGKLGLALDDLQQSAVAPVDLQQASIGPGMAVFSKYAKVMESDGSPMPVRQALMLINQVLDEVLAEQEGEFDPDTRFAVVWFEQFGFNTGDYGTAETLANAKAVSVKGVVDAGILESGANKVRLLAPDELDPGWAPETDDRLTVWEVTHYLCRALDSGGVDAAAGLARRVGGHAYTSRDLAYRLFSICEKKKWTDLARPYNALVALWPDIQRAAAGDAAAPAANKTTDDGGLFDG